MNGIFYGLKPSDMLKSRNREFVEAVSGLWDRYVAKEEDYMRRDCVLLEDMGHWLQQRSWTDGTGYFLKIRLAPLDCHRVDVQDRARAVVQGFLDLFPGRKNVYYKNSEALDGGTEVLTVVVEVDSFSIGD